MYLKETKASNRQLCYCAFCVSKPSIRSFKGFKTYAEVLFVNKLSVRFFELKLHRHLGLKALSHWVRHDNTRWIAHEWLITNGNFMFAWQVALTTTIFFFFLPAHHLLFYSLCMYPANVMFDTTPETQSIKYPSDLKYFKLTIKSHFLSNSLPQNFFADVFVVAVTIIWNSVLKRQRYHPLNIHSFPECFSSALSVLSPFFSPFCATPATPD